MDPGLRASGFMELKRSFESQYGGAQRRRRRVVLRRARWEEEEESKETMRAEPNSGPHLPLQHISSGS